MFEYDLGFHAVQHAKADAGSTCSCYGLRWALYVCLLPLPVPFFFTEDYFKLSMILKR